MLYDIDNSLYIESLKMGDSKQMHQFWHCDLFLQMASSRCEHFKVVCCSLSIPAQTIQLARFLNLLREGKIRNSRLRTPITMG
ncbi:hypothetical protein Peur_014902 [Populus x canadensis]